MELTDYRDRFPILEHTTYLINHSLGAMPRAVDDRLAEYARTWAERGIRAWGEGWWTMPLEVGDQVGRIVGAAPGTTVMHQNVTVAEAIAERHPDHSYTNVEFWSSVVLDVAEIPPPLAPAMFACSRVAGWSAHILEQKRTGRLFRPSARYVGPSERHLAEVN